MPFNKKCGCKNHQVFWEEGEFKLLKVHDRKIKVLVVGKLREGGYITARTNNLCKECVKYAEVNNLTISLHFKSAFISLLQICTISVPLSLLLPSLQIKEEMKRYLTL